MYNSGSSFLLLDYRLYLVDVTDVSAAGINEETFTPSLTLDERGLFYSVEEGRRVLSGIILSINTCVTLTLFSIPVSTIST